MRDDSGVLERLEPLLQQCTGEPRHAATDLIEPPRSGKELADDQQGPALRQDFGRQRDRTELPVFPTHAASLRRSERRDKHRGPDFGLALGSVDVALGIVAEMEAAVIACPRRWTMFDLAAQRLRNCARCDDVRNRKIELEAAAVEVCMVSVLL